MNDPPLAMAGNPSGNVAALGSGWRKKADYSRFVPISTDAFDASWQTLALCAATPVSNHTEQERCRDHAALAGHATKRVLILWLTEVAKCVRCPISRQPWNSCHHEQGRRSREIARTVHRRGSVWPCLCPWRLRPSDSESRLPRAFSNKLRWS